MSDVLNQISVRVTIFNEGLPVNQGSGFMLKSGSLFYVVTAYHCVYGENDEFIDLPITSIAIERQETFNSEFHPCSVIEVVECHKGEDWAVIRIGYTDEDSIFPEYHLAGVFNTNESVSFRGYQNVDPETGRTFGSRVLEKSSNNEFKITLNPGEYFKEGSADAKGLSGSGAFIMADDKLYVLGLLKSVKGEEALNNDIKCCPISAFHTLLGRELVDIGVPSDFDKTAEEEFEKVNISDARDLNEKIIGVCPEIPIYRLAKYARDLSTGKVELERYSQREMSAVKFRVFEACQEDLMNFVEHRQAENVTVEEINDLITRYTQKASSIIATKSVLYKYPKLDDDLLRRVVLDLINDCFLSFDKAGIYEE
ncbi:serine protease family protein [Pedobacter frigoris]|uniref:Uncharacterized protein n=1 Tax=Pedobacter frigoris TaxID=2571272 RepID=A0A4U1CKZ8_9SPHI|nr:hypothetical protein [Pedobacter frigoris]TKC06941.1 hypothetical protein FA047_06630 [Pedobacter frigoris]